MKVHTFIYSYELPLQRYINGTTAHIRQSLKQWKIPHNLKAESQKNKEWFKTKGKRYEK